MEKTSLGKRSEAWRITVQDEANTNAEIIPGKLYNNGIGRRKTCFLQSVTDNGRQACSNRVWRPFVPGTHSCWRDVATSPDAL